MNSPVQSVGPNPRRYLCFSLLLGLLVSGSTVQAAKGNKEERKELRREMGVDDPGAKLKNRDVPADPRSARSASTDPQNRTLTRLREQLEVDDDDEWDVIAQRIGKLEEARRGTSPGAATDRSKRTSSNIERDMLKAAVSDKLPEAEIKSRLARAREAYRQNEDRLAAAQTDLRDVLTVRQEAIVVLAGLLPP
jgi:hypothetical protein